MSSGFLPGKDELPSSKGSSIHAQKKHLQHWAVAEPRASGSHYTPCPQQDFIACKRKWKSMLPFFPWFYDPFLPETPPTHLPVLMYPCM